MTPKPDRCRACPGWAWGSEGFMAAPAGTGENGVLILGEALGEQEAEAGQPFVGKAGHVLRGMLKREGLTVEAFRIENCLRCRPPNNDITLPTAQAALAYCPFWRETLREAPPKAIVALGNTAFRQATGLPNGITEARGYIHRGLSGIPVIATYHPAFLARGNQRLSRVFSHDIKQAVDVAAGGVPAYQPDYCLDPTPVQAGYWVERYEAALRADPTTILAYDIETPFSVKSDEAQLDLADDPTYTIHRISFAFEANTAMTIPWRADYMGLIRRLLEVEAIRVNWNGRYDDPRIAFNGVEIRGPRWDMMLGWHVLNSDLEKGLGFVTPFYAPQIPMWKHLSGSQPSFYSAVDADATWQNARGIIRDLKAHRLWDVFDRHIVQLDPILEAMGKAGLQIDLAAREALAKDLYTEQARLADLIDQAVPVAARPVKVYKKAPKESAGLIEVKAKAEVKVCSVCGKKATKVHPCVKKGEAEIVRKVVETSVWHKPLPFKLSNVALKRYQAVRRHEPVHTKDRERRVTFDADACKALAKRYPHDPLYPLIVNYREVEKIGATYSGTWDPEQGRVIGGMPMDLAGRIHPVYVHNPSTLRLACINPNAQNFPSGRKDAGGNDFQARIKQMVVADPGHTLVEIDFSAIEAVLVGYFAHSSDYIRLAKIGVHDYLNSHILYRSGKIDHPADTAWSDADLKACLKDLKKRFKPEREVAKRIIHGSNYGMAPSRMYSLYPESFGSLKRAAELQRIYFEVCPAVKRWQTQTIQQAHEAAQLRNPFGYVHWFWRVIQWKQNPIGEWEQEWGEDAKRALAFLPQSTAAGLIKEAMLKIQAAALDPWLRLQVHDSLVLHLPEDHVEAIGRQIFAIMTEPCPALPLDSALGLGVCLGIGAEAKVGRTWGTMKEVAW